MSVAILAQVSQTAFSVDSEPSPNMPKCKVCAWRRRLIVDAMPDPRDGTDAPPDECDSEWPPILAALHQFPGRTWVDIIQSNTLSKCSLPMRRTGSTREWIRIPLRIAAVHLELQSDTDFVFEGLSVPADHYVVAYHNTKLEHLVNPPTWNWPDPGPPSPNYGILRQMRLAYGRCSHNANVGVNVYADGGLETFEGTQGWVQLEVLCQKTTRLGGRGREHRYCMCGPSDELCLYAALEALWVPKDELPAMVLLS